jgi:hypothetical protein
VPRDGAIVFGDLIGKLDMLSVSCDKCGRGDLGDRTGRRLLEYEGKRHVRFIPNSDRESGHLLTPG